MSEYLEFCLIASTQGNQYGIQTRLKIAHPEVIVKLLWSTPLLVLTSNYNPTLFGRTWENNFQIIIKKITLL